MELKELEQYVRDQLRAMSTRMMQLELRNVRAGSLAEISDDAGVQRAGAFYALSSGSYPTDPDACGVGMDAAGVDFDGELYNDFGVHNGRLTFSRRAIDGAAVFAGGKGMINDRGILLRGILYALQLFAAAEDGTGRRFGGLEMYYPTGQTVPALRLSFENDPEDSLIDDSGFEDEPSGWVGETTGEWKGSDVVEIATIGAYEGQRCGHIKLSNPGGQNQAKGGLLRSSSGAVLAGGRYELQLYRRLTLINTGAGIEARVGIEWLNSSGVVISSISLGLTEGNWEKCVLSGVAPVGAVEARGVISLVHDQDGGTLYSGAELWVDAVYLTEKSVDYWLEFGPDLRYSHGLWPQVAGWMADQMSGATVARTIHASQECNAVWWQSSPALNDERTIKLALEKGTWTLVLVGETANACGQCTVYLNDVQQGSVLEWYSSAVTYNVERSVSITVPYNGVHTLKLRVTGRHGSAVSPYYQLRLTRARMWKQ